MKKFAAANNAASRIALSDHVSILKRSARAGSGYVKVRWEMELGVPYVTQTLNCFQTDIVSARNAVLICGKKVKRNELLDRLWK